MDTTTNTSINSTATFSCWHSKQTVNNKRTRSVCEVLQEMPIASGAAGRVDVGVDTSTTWTPDGLKRRTKPVNRNCDSYLQRYQELKERKNKSNLMRGTQDNTDKGDHEDDGAKEEIPLKNGGSEEHTSGKPSSGERSKKSQLCVLL